MAVQDIKSALAPMPEQMSGVPMMNGIINLRSLFFIKNMCGHYARCAVSVLFE